MSSNNTTLMTTIAGISAACLLITAPLLLLHKSPKTSESSSSTTTITDIDEDDETTTDPSSLITPTLTIQIFDDLFIQMQSVVAQLTAQIQQLKMSGQIIPEQQLRQLLKAEFERGLMAKQGAIFESYDVDEECLEEATWEFLKEGDEKVTKAVERFQKLYESVSGERVVGVRPGDDKGDDNPLALERSKEVVSKDELIRLSNVYFSAMTKAMSEIAAKLKAQGISLSDPSVAQQLSMQLGMVANDAGEDALKKEGATVEEFRRGVERYREDPEVNRTLGMLQLKQQQELMAMGVAAM